MKRQAEFVSVVVILSWRSGASWVGGSCSWAVYVVCGRRVACCGWGGRLCCVGFSWVGGTRCSWALRHCSQLGSVVVGLLYLDILRGRHRLCVCVDGWGVVVHQGAAAGPG